MPSTYTSNNKIQKIATGEQSGTWGATTNTNFDLFDTAIDGFVSVSLSGTTHTLNIPDGSAGDGRNKVLVFTGSLSGANTVTVTPNTVKKHYFVQNNTTGGQNVIIAQGSGSTVTVKPGYSSVVYLDGAGSGAAVKEVLTGLKLTALIEATGAVLVGSSSGSTTLQASATASGTLTLPAATDTLVGKATTDTLTNKTLSSSVLTGTLTAGGGVGTNGQFLQSTGTGVQWATGGLGTVTSITAGTGLTGGTITTSGTIAIDSTVLTASNTQTLTNKTFDTAGTGNVFRINSTQISAITGTGSAVLATSPSISNPALTGAVGINVSPSYTLEIRGSGGTSTAAVTAPGGIGEVQWFVNNSTGLADMSSIKQLRISVSNAEPMIFRTSGAERVRFDSVGNVKIGGTADRGTTAGTNHLDIFNGTAPVGTLTNGISIYSSSGEAYVMDASGNATLFSPHDRETNEWIFNSIDTKTGKRLKIKVERLLRFLNEKFGLDCIEDLIEEVPGATNG